MTNEKNRVFYYDYGGSGVAPFLIKDNKLFSWGEQKFVFTREINEEYGFFEYRHLDNMPKQLQKIYIDQHYETTGELIILS